jgi:putative DNA primase/helicase
VWIPEASSDRVDGGTYNQMPFWVVRKAAVALEICPEDAFVDRKGEDGTYQGFPGYETYNETLEAIEDAGLNHGREQVTPEEDAVDNKSESSADSSPTDERSDDLDRAHLREKNRLLTAKVKRIESELEDKSERIEELEAEVDQLRTELGTVRSERDRLETALEERRSEKESNQNDRNESQSPFERARRYVPFDS